MNPDGYMLFRFHEDDEPEFSWFTDLVLALEVWDTWHKCARPGSRVMLVAACASPYPVRDGDVG